MDLIIESNETSLTTCLEAYFGKADFELVPITGDASFKIFYRLIHQHQTYMVMLAPPDKEKVTEFFEIDNIFIQRGVSAPKILAVNLIQGFFLMEDFGDELYSQILSEQNRDELYRKALVALLKIQSGPLPNLPKFDESLIQTECDLFTQWALPLLNLSLNTEEKVVLTKLFKRLIDHFLAQPQVLVHRDYHSRNLFVLSNPERSPGVIDFQDAVIGPITYDVVSLLKDCYVSWPPDKIRPILEDFYISAKLKNKDLMASFEQFNHWVDWTGLQRHIKVLGIFARLYVRDNKPRYVYDMPRIVQYILAVAQNYPELSDFHGFIQNRVEPALSQFLKELK